MQNGTSQLQFEKKQQLGESEATEEAKLFAVKLTSYLNLNQQAQILLL